MYTLLPALRFHSDRRRVAHTTDLQARCGRSADEKNETEGPHVVHGCVVEKDKDAIFVESPNRFS